jgi:precorrin-6A/cobalt-precorrin-6A reductase
MRILILGGTGEALDLAAALHEKRHHVIFSLAGRTKTPAKPKGEVISGGFGGADGLAAYLAKSKIDYLIDATHPFSSIMSGNAVQAAEKAGVPLLRINRPAWDEPKGAGWWHVKDEAEAAGRLPAGGTVFLAIGRQRLEPFFVRKGCRFTVRTMEMPEMDLPGNFTLIVERPPMDWRFEAAFFQKNRFTHMVARNSGSDMSYAKIEAAYMLKIQVIMIGRPENPPAPEVANVTKALEILAQLPEPKKRFFFLP